MNRNGSILATAAGAALVAIGGLCHGHLIAERSDRLDALTLEIQELRSQPGKPAGRDRVADLRDQLDAPFQRDVGDLLHLLTETLVELRVEEKSITTQEAHDTGPFREVPVHVAYRGPFVSAFELGRRLQEQYPITRLERLEVTRDGRAIDHDTLSIEIHLLAYQRATEEGS